MPTRYLVGVAVHIRPGLNYFLKLLDHLFEVIVFTAGEQDYADAVLDYVDPEGFISHRLYRESTCEHRGLNYVKDLNHLGRDLARCVLLDNNIISMAANPDNCILIDDFFTDKRDRELPLVASILMDLNELDDIRPVLKDAFNIREQLTSRFSSLQGFLEVGQDQDQDDEEQAAEHQEATATAAEHKDYDEEDTNSLHSSGSVDFDAFSSGVSFGTGSERSELEDAMDRLSFNQR